MSDDFLAILHFSLEWRAQPTTGAKLLEIIASQHNEYKLIVLHAFVAAELAFTGKVHLGFLIWVGNLMLPGIAWLLWQHVFPDEKHLRKRLLLFAPIAWLFFQLNYAENLDWAMCGLQTVPVIFFCLAALHLLLDTGKRAFGGACACAVLGCFSSANGFLLAPIGFLVLLQNRRWRRAVLWSGVYALALTAYLYHYHPFQPPDFSSHTPWLQKVQFFLSFLGAAAENMHHLPVRNLSIVLGLFIVGFVPLAWMRRGEYKDPFFLCVAAWCFFTAAVVTQGRTGEGVVLALTLRYKVYSDLLLIVCYQYLAVQVSRSKELSPRGKRLSYGTALLATVVFALIADSFGYRFLMVRQRSTQGALARFAADPAHEVPEISAIGVPIRGGEPELARQILVRCLEDGIYSLPSRKDGAQAGLR